MGMTIEEYMDIKLQQECVSKTIDALWKMVLKYREIEMRMTLDEAIKRYKNNAEYERTHGDLQGCLEFKQLAKWLEELRAYRNMYHADNVDNCLREKVVDNGNDD